MDTSNSKREYEKNPQDFRKILCFNIYQDEVLKLQIERQCFSKLFDYLDAIYSENNRAFEF